MLDISSIQQYLNQSTDAMNNASTNIEINKILEKLVTSITQSEFSSIWIYDQSKSILLREREEGFIREVDLNSKKGLLYKCFATKTPAITNYLASEKGYEAVVDNPDNIRMKSKIMIPLIDDARLVGIVTAYSSISQIKNFDSNDLEIFSAITPHIINYIYKMSSEIFEEKSQDDKKRSTDTLENLSDIEKARQNTQTPENMLNNMAKIVHDIRTPANGLFGFLEILEEEIDNPRLKQYINHAKDSAHLINELTTSILDGVSTKREPKLSHLERVSTLKFFADIADIFSSNMYQKQISYNIFLDPLLPKEITIDSLKLKRVIMNLISNANKFTPLNGTIEFSVRYKSKDKKVHIFIKDSGIGIVKAKQEDIFKAFEQAEDDTNVKYGGIGLGLSISATYINELGGKILVDSEINQGSTFYFDIPVEINDDTTKLPLSEGVNNKIVILMENINTSVANHMARYMVKMGMEADSIQAVKSITKIQSDVTHIIVFENKFDKTLLEFTDANGIQLMVVEEKFLSFNTSEFNDLNLISQYSYYADELYSFLNAKRRPKILVVDDDMISVSLIKTILKNEFCEIDLAYDGLEAMRLLEKSVANNRTYDLIYMDSSMPFLTGEEVLANYREIEHKKNLNPITAISISGDTYSSKKGVNNYDIYVGKPFNKQEIKTIFANATK